MRTSALLALLITATLGMTACNDKSAVPAKAPAISTAAAVDGQSTAGHADWSALQADVGKYPSDMGLYEHSVISKPLQKLLGDKFDTFKTNMQTSGPLQSDGVLYVTGNKPHEGGSDAAYLLIDPTTQQLEVGLWQAKELTVYRTANAELSKPKDVQTMLQNNAEN